MAITKTTFTGATQAANAPEVLAWLQDNATEFFLTIAAENSDNNFNIICTTSTGGKLIFGFDETVKNHFELANGVSSTGYFTDILVRTAYKTSKGIFLIQESTNDRDKYYFITKSNAGNTSIIQLGAQGTNSKLYYLFADLTANSAIYYPKSNVSTYSAVQGLWSMQSPSSLTTMTPVPLGNGGTYTPDLFLMTYNEFFGYVGKIVVDGVEYVTDGVFALKE